MKNKWSSKKVKELQDWLVLRWPDVFTPGPDQLPLSLSIHKEILKYRQENPQISCRLLSEALNRHVTSYGYLYGMLKNNHRHDLSGTPVEPVSSAHRAWARNTLRAKQKVAQKVRKEMKLQQKLKGKPQCAGKPAVPRSMVRNKIRERSIEIPLDNKATGTTAPVIRYKQSRRKMIVDRNVDLAS